MTENPAPTFQVEATQFTLNASMVVATPEQAREVAASFPKNAKVKGGTLWVGSTGEKKGLVQFQAHLAADGVNGGRNETGIKRYHTFRRQAEKLGYGFTYTMPYRNSLSQTELDAAVAQ